jgi:putative nucleotidyltransferase with HDIG domain
LTYDWSTKRVEAERQKNTELNRVFLSTIEALAMAIDAKDQVTHGHIRRVQRYTMALAEALGIKNEIQTKALQAAALLHDTGKLAVPEYILNKPGALTASEFERMKLHAAVGADILKSIDFPYPVEPIVRHHHENWDGTGYPDGLAGQAIPLGARILSVVDCFDALTSDRPYRPRMTRPQAEQILKDRRNKMYDPWIVDEFLKILDQLERIDAAEQIKTALGDGQASSSRLKPAQFDVISSTTAEESEFN